MNSVQKTQQRTLDMMSKLEDGQTETTLYLAIQLIAQSINETSITAGPSHYLLKLIVRQFGPSFLKKLVKSHSWVVPGYLMWNEEVCVHRAGVFEIYNENIVFYRILISGGQVF